MSELHRDEGHDLRPLGAPGLAAQGCESGVYLLRIERDGEFVRPVARALLVAFRKTRHEIDIGKAGDLVFAEKTVHARVGEHARIAGYLHQHIAEALRQSRRARFLTLSRDRGIAPVKIGHRFGGGGVCAAEEKCHGESGCERCSQNNVYAARRPGELPLLGDGKEVLQLTKFHPNTSYREE